MKVRDAEDRVYLIGRIARGEREVIQRDAYCNTLESALWLNVLQAIAEGCDNAQKLAETALKTQKISFSRVKE